MCRHICDIKLVKICKYSITLWRNYLFHSDALLTPPSPAMEVFISERNERSTMNTYKTDGNV